MALICQLIVPA